MTEKGRDNHIVFALSAVCINYMLNENTDIFRKSLGPAALCQHHECIIDSATLYDINVKTVKMIVMVFLVLNIFILVNTYVHLLAAACHSINITRHILMFCVWSFAFWISCSLFETHDFV